MLGEWWMRASVSSGLSRWHLPSQMFHCILPTTPPEGSAVNPGIRPPSPPYWKGLMMNNKATGLRIYHLFHELSALQPTELSFARIGAECWSRRQWKLQDRVVNSGQISVIPSDWLSRPPGAVEEEAGVGSQSRQTDSRSQTPLESDRDTDATLLFWEVDSSEERWKWWWRRRKWNKQDWVITAKKIKNKKHSWLFFSRNSGTRSTSPWHFKLHKSIYFYLLNECVWCERCEIAESYHAAVPLSSVQRFSGFSSVFWFTAQAPLFCAWKWHTENIILPVFHSFWLQTWVWSGVF